MYQPCDVSTRFPSISRKDWNNTLQNGKYCNVLHHDVRNDQQGLLTLLPCDFNATKLTDPVCQSNRVHIECCGRSQHRCRQSRHNQGWRHSCRTPHMFCGFKEPTRHPALEPPIHIRNEAQQLFHNSSDFQCYLPHGFWR